MTHAQSVTLLSRARPFAAVVLCTCLAHPVLAATYSVGPDQPYATPSDVPWELLQPGDEVVVHWRSTPYRDKWVIARQGTEADPIVVRGVPGPGGELPIIEGNGATTRLALDYWGEPRAVIKIGGASVPADTMPRYITIDGLDVRAARPPYAFVDDAGNAQAYAPNAAAIWIEKGEHIVIRNSRLHDAGNGLFVSSADPNVSRDILIEGNAIFDNGNVGSIYEHNTYTEALGITYQFNYMGPTKSGAGGNNLKDRSAGLVVRDNWIAGGNRQLDLVETDSPTIQGDPSYRTTFVYGNVLVEPDAAGNRQIAHYGGDSGITSKYRKGTLHFYNNTMVSTRTDRTTLFRLSTNEETADVRNNIFYVTAAGTTLSLVDASGVLRLSHNWFKPGRATTFGTLTGSIVDDGTSIVGSAPGFRDESVEDFRLAADAEAANRGTSLAPAVLPEHSLARQYVKHQASEARPDDGVVDLGAFEVTDGIVPPLVITTTALPGGTATQTYAATLAASGGIAPYSWSVIQGTLPNGLSLNTTSGAVAGMPTVPGRFGFTVQALDAQSPADVATAALTIDVANAPAPPPVSISTTSLPNARRNRTYSRTLSATGGVAPYTWRVVSGGLPPGLSLGTSGTISGRVATLGRWTFEVQAADSQATPSTARRTFSITVQR